MSFSPITINQSYDGYAAFFASDEYGQKTISGSNNLYLDRANNRFGIGTFVPTEKLEVVGNLKITGGEIKNEALTQALQSITQALDGYTTEVSSGVTAQSQSDGYLAFFIGTNILAGDNDLFWDRANNRLGVGTQTPSEKFTCAGNARIDGDIFTSGTRIELGQYGTGNRHAYIDFHGDDTYTDYGLRIQRENAGPNTDSILWHRGTGSLKLNAYDLGSVVFATNSTSRMTIDSAGKVGVGCTPTTPFHADPGAGGVARIAHISGADNAGSHLEVINQRADGNGTFGGRIGLSHWRSDGTSTASTAALGAVYFGGPHGGSTTYVDANNLYSAAIIGHAAENRTSASNLGTDLAFYTATNATATLGKTLGEVNSFPGVERMRITSAGLVGIGNIAPTAALQLGDKDTGTGEATAGGTLKIAGEIRDTLAGVGGIDFKIAGDSSGYGNKIQAISAAGSALLFAGRQASATWSEYARFASTGKFGIATTSPQALLDIKGPGALTNIAPVLVAGRSSAILDSPINSVVYNSEIDFSIGNVGRLLCMSVRRVAGGADWDSAGMRIQAAVDSSFTAYNSGRSYIEFAELATGGAAGSAALLMGTAASYDTMAVRNGRVGVGTTDPQITLHVKNNGSSLCLEGTDHTYLGWYPLGFASGRKGYTGFGSSTNTHFSVATEVGTSDILLLPGSGKVGIGTTPASGATLHVNSSTNCFLHLDAPAANQSNMYLCAAGAPKWQIGRQGYSHDLFIYNDGRSTSDIQIVDSSGDITMPGDVGIGGNPAYRLDVQANVSGHIASFFNDGNDSNRWGILIQCGKDTRSAEGDCLWAQLADGDGSSVAYIKNTTSAPYAAFIASSDARLKKDIRPTEVNGLDVINAIDLVSFDWINEEHPAQKIGYIAQQVQTVYPDMVSKLPDGYLGVSDSCLVPVLVKSLQEMYELMQKQQKEIDTLKEIVSKK